MTNPERDAIRCTISINFRDTEVSIARGDETLWSNRIGDGAIDWIISILNYLRFTHNLLIGRRTAESILVALGAAEKLASPIVQTVRGRSLETGLPHSVEVSSNQLCEAFGVKWLVFQITGIITGPERSEDGTLIAPHSIPSELKAMLANRPVILGGEFGGLRGLDHVLQEALKLTVVTKMDNDTGG
jgi:rod shape-determining protein MreB